jgi:nucleotide-binding universal stress UspA family protein
MYERILVPLDGSRVGEAALPYVEDIVSKLSPEVKVEITFFQAVSSLIHYVLAGEAATRVPYTESEMKQIKKKAMDYLKKAGKGLRSKGAVVSAKVAVGDASEEIIKAAEEINADLIAMSTHGRSGLSRWAFGSVTDKVLRRGGRIPVVMVKALKEAEKT